MAGKKVRIGFVGVGGMGQCAHLRNYASESGCEVVALAELREPIARRVAAKYNVPKIYSDAAAMLKAEKLDGIVASQPFSRHGILIPDLLKANTPIFIEKPLSSTLESAKAVLKALKKSKTWIMVGYHKRSDPASMYAKAEVDKLKASGELGKMRYVRILMPAGDWIANGFFDLVRDDEPMPKLTVEPPPTDMDENGFKEFKSFVNYYIHQVNLMRFFLGESYKAKYVDKAGVLLVGESDSGITCTIEMTPYQTTVDWQESVLVAFERGWVKVELPAPVAVNRPGRVEIYRDPGKGVTPMLSSPQLPWDHAMRMQARNFIAAIRGERKPPCDAFEAIEDLKVARDYLRLRFNK
jgi:predicted dehydrogenase